MPMINYSAREINCKVVYYGPALCGKTTNLEVIHRRVAPESRGTLVSLATETDRTLFFDFLPVDLGTVRGFTTRFHLYTVPGQVQYDASRRLILKGVDGIVFVADSSPDRLEANVESLRNLEENLRSYGYDPEAIPLVLQYNKRDLPDAVGTEMLDAALRAGWTEHAPTHESVARDGTGVFETLRDVSTRVIASLP
ncbi:MAG: GTP-binding protein [Gemmatimonadaceae bacterium]